MKEIFEKIIDAIGHVHSTKAKWENIAFIAIMVAILLLVLIAFIADKF